ncbi:MAG: sugar phosphate isomerase/epimerase family protein [Blastocatellia bacterium]
MSNVLGSAAGLCCAKAGGARGRSNASIRKVGLQLYTVRKELEKDFEGTLGKVAAIGYKEVEFAGYFNHDPGQVKAILNRNGLAAPSAHVTLKAIKEDFGRAVETAKAIGHRYLILAYLSAEERTSLDDYKRLADALNRAGEDCKKAGLQLGYHNHDFEFQAMRGEVPYDLLLRDTDPALVKMELDLYWITKAGQQPEKYFGQYPGRFELFHVKDMDNTPRRFFTEVGRGVIDFKRIFAHSEQAGVKHYFVEQDETPGSPYDSIRVSFDYLRRLRF